MQENSKELVQKVVKILSDKRAKDIVAFDINKVSILSDYFIVCSGSSTTHIQALADEVEDKMNEDGYTLNHIEGYASARWILMDYGEIVIHIFYHELRNFYNIERLWADAESVDIEKYIDKV